MTAATNFFTTGNTVLPDIGNLSYNNVTFNPLFRTRVSGAAMPDEANRTIKLNSYTLYAEGVVTGANDRNCNNIMDALRDRLTRPAQPLEYTLKGFGKYAINVPGKSQYDQAWGPIPKLLEFSPLGGSTSAMVKWQVTVNLSELAPSNVPVPLPIATLAGVTLPVLQFNWAAHIGYDERGYSQLSINGTLEVPLTRTSAQSRAVAYTVDDFRSRWLNVPVDLSKFRVTNRRFDYSRDKRTCEFSFQMDELPPMGLPPGCTVAHGTFSVRNANTPTGRGGVGAKLSFTSWICSLRCTYVVRGDQDRRVAMHAFWSLLWFRMAQSQFGFAPALRTTTVQNQQNPAGVPAARTQQGMLAAAAQGLAAIQNVGIPQAQADDSVALWQSIMNATRTFTALKAGNQGMVPLLLDYGFDEGLYLDSDTISLHASWWMVTNFQNLITASGFAKWLPGTAGRADNLWSQSVKSIMGWSSWLENRINPNSDVIVDFGGGVPFGGK